MSRCKTGTLLVRVTFSGASLEATQLSVAVTINGVSGAAQKIAHSAGVASGNLEVDFPRGYPKGEAVGVTVAALLDGVDVGDGRVLIDALSAGCASVMLSVTGAGDFAVPGDSGDLGGESSDGASPDLPSDLASACTPTVEDCFNGLDDDCDGLVDCADTVDCPASVASCVPAVLDARYGTALPFGGGGTTQPACPQKSATAQLLFGDFPAPGTFYCDGCSAPISGSASLTVNSNTTASCMSGPQTTAVGTLSGNSCSGPITLSNQWGTGQVSGWTCGAVTGTAVVPPSGVRTDEFCASSRIGGGCIGGEVCAPAVAKACVLVAATTSCATTAYSKAYVPDNGAWFETLDDTRSCPSSCSSQTAGPAHAMLVGYAGAGCSGMAVLKATAYTVIGQYNGCTTPGTYSLELSAPTSCPVLDQGAGSVSGSGAQPNVCCLP